VSERTTVRVAAAILQRRDGKVLLAQRLPATPYAGFWEFPGGKLEPGESARDALRRELDEELGIVVTRAAPWLIQRYDYPHAHVELEFFRVFEWHGEPHGRDGQAIAWQQPAAIEVTPLLPANAPVLRALALPPVYAISMAEDLGEVEFLARAHVALDAGLALIQLREKSFAPERLRALADRLLAIAEPHGARVLLNGDADTARELGCAGVHWSAARLVAARSRPRDMLCAASVHDAAELAQAASLGVDFAVLGTVRATPSHPDARPLGWQRFAELAAGSPMPVYALGGLSAEDLDVAIAHGAHGVALRRAAWPALPQRIS
jgi:8-oxo-dGTP diphosphatase